MTRRRWSRSIGTWGCWCAAPLLALASVFSAPLTSLAQPRAVAPAAPAAGVEVPFELTGNKIYVQVRIGEHGPYWFAVDTGSPTTVLDTDVAKALEIQPRGASMTGGAGQGGMLGGIAEVADITLGPVPVLSRTVLIIPVQSSLSPYDGRVLQGLVGNDTLAKHVVEIDYAAHVLRFREPAAYEYHGDGAVIPVTIGGYTFVTAAIKPVGQNEIEGRFIIDTGARLGLGLNAPFVRQHRLLDPEHPLARMIVGFGVGGAVKHSVGRLDRISIGPAGLDNPIATYSEENRGVFSTTRFSGVIGGEFLRRFTVILDYRRHRIILEKNANYADPVEFDMSGLWYCADGDDFAVLKIQSVVSGSPADEAGVRKGDIITEIDGKPTSQTPLDQVRSLLRREGEERVFTIQRGDEQVKITIKLRRLV